MTPGLLAATLALGAAAVAVQKDGTWIEVKSPSFVVLTDAGGSAARSTISRFEKIRGAFAAVMPSVKLSGERELLIIAPRSETSLRSLVPEWWEKKGGIRPASVHLNGPDHVFLLVRTDLREDDDESYHAAHWGYSSHLIGLNAPRLPLWAWRGLSDFYARTSVLKDRVLIGRAAASHVRTLRQRGLLPVSDLWAVDRQSPEYTDWARRERFDAECWALVHYLMLSDKGVHRPKLARFLGLLAEEVGRGPDAGRARAAEAAREALGDSRQLDEALASYVRHQAFYVESIRAEVDSGKVPTSPERPLSSAEALAMRAAVHLASERYPDAHACLDEALRLDPKLAWAHEIRAGIAWAEDDPALAREAALQALALEPGRPVATRLRERAFGPPTMKGAERLCDGGDLAACASLGGWLIDGSGGTADPARGIALIAKACGGGNVEACRQLSWRHREGKGVPVDAGRAVALLEQACAAGDTRSCLAAASDHQTGRGVPVDPAAAARMFEPACTRGERSACVALAWILQSGEGVPRDLERAAALYEDGCRAGDGSSCTRLGLLYVSRDGLPNDPARAQELLGKGCDLGDLAGCSNLEIVTEMSAKTKKPRRR